MGRNTSIRKESINADGVDVDGGFHKGRLEPLMLILILQGRMLHNQGPPGAPPSPFNLLLFNSNSSFSATKKE